MFTQKRKTGQALVLILVAAFLLVSGFTNVAIALNAQPENGAQSDNEAQSENEPVRMGEVSRLLGMIASSEEVDQETTIDALEGLSEGIIEKLEERNVPEETINRFEEEFSSALTLFEDGAITKNQLADQASASAMRMDQEFDNGLPVELLEEKGINAEAIQTLKNEARNLSGPEVAEIARSISGRGKNKGKKKGKGQEKAKEKREEAKERKEERREEREEEDS